MKHLNLIFNFLLLPFLFLGRFTFGLKSDHAYASQGYFLTYGQGIFPSGKMGTKRNIFTFLFIIFVPFVLNAGSTVDVAINDVQIVEGNSGTKNIVFTLSTSGNSAKTGGLSWHTVQGPGIGAATEVEDYIANSGTINGITTSTTPTISIQINGDTKIEPNEIFTIKLDTPTGNLKITNDTGTGTIENDDTPPRNDYRLTIDSVVISEANSPAVVNVRVDPALSASDSLQVHWATGNAADDATAPSDYTSGSGTMTLTSTSTNNISIPIINDAISEPQESFSIVISNASIATSSGSTVVIATGTGTVTINDDDTAGLATLSINDRTVAEDAGIMTFTVTRSSPATSDVTFSYATGDNTAEAPGDYTLTSGTGVITAGYSTSTITVPIINDEIAGEGSETFDIVISNPSTGTELGDSLGVGTITDEDAGLTLDINDAQVAEGDDNITAVVRVNFSMPLPADMNITYHTSDNTAKTPDDYGTLSQTVNVLAGSSYYDINVIITGDTTSELTEDFSITLDSASAGYIADAESIVTIFDNDGIGGCSSYVGMMTINEYQNNPSYKDSNHPLASNSGHVPGNYVEIKYLDFLVKQYVNNSWTISVITKTGKFDTLYWNENDPQCTDPRYEIFEIDNRVMGAEGYVVIKDGNGNEVDILSIASPNNLVQQCQDFLYDTDFESSAQNKDLFRVPDGTGDWFDHGSGANSGGSRCINRDGTGGESVYTEFDAIDTDEGIPTQVINQSSVPIKTKIVNDSFDLNILDINTSTGFLNPITVDIKAYLGDSVTGDKLPGTNIGKSVSFVNQSLVTVYDFVYDRAVKSAVVFFEYCEDSYGATTNWNTCWISDTQADLDKRRTSLSRDTFAIRPKDFSSSISSGDVFIAMLPTNLVFQALDGGVAQLPTNEYNETQNSSFVVDLNVSGVCAKPNLDINRSSDGSRVHFVHGEDSDAFTFSDVGDVNMSIHEISGAEFALTDADDTLDDNVRLIAPYEASFTVIPDHFEVNATLADHHTSIDDNFTYISSDLNMSSLLDINITSQGFDNNTTVNYTDGCFAHPIDLDIALSYNPATFAPNTPSSILYHLEAEGSIFTLDSYSSILTQIDDGTDMDDLNKSIFPLGTHSGTAELKIKLNLARKYNEPINPFTMNVTDINVTDDYDSSNIVHDAPGTNAPDHNANYYFARAKSSKYFYDDVTDSSIATQISVVVYNDPATSAYFLLTTFKPTDEYDWYLSILHNANDGNVTLEALSGGNVSPTDPTSVSISNGIDSTVAVSSSGGSLPEDVPITFGPDTNSWMIYNEDNDSIPNPFYHVRFIGVSGWAGHGQTGYVVDSNASSKKNRRLGW